MCLVASEIQHLKVQLLFTLFEERTDLQNLTSRNSALNSFYSKIHKISTCCLETCLLSSICIKGHNLVCNELAMRKIPVDVSETLFNVLKGVKKVRSAFHQRIWKHAKQTIAENSASFMHMSVPVIHYSVCTHFLLWTISYSYIF